MSKTVINYKSNNEEWNTAVDKAFEKLNKKAMELAGKVYEEASKEKAKDEDKSSKKKDDKEEDDVVEATYEEKK